MNFEGVVPRTLATPVVGGTWTVEPSTTNRAMALLK